MEGGKVELVSQDEKKQQLKKQKAALELMDKRLNSVSEPKLKLILVGNSGVGKTSLLRKFLDETADIRNTETTIFCDFHHCAMRLYSRTVHLRIWDTGGMEKFQTCSLTRGFYRNANGVLLVFALDDFASFTCLPTWLEICRSNVGTSAFDCCVVGNKKDCAAALVSEREGQRYANSQGMQYIETSAAESVNVQKAFCDLVLLVLRRQEIMQTAAAPAESTGFRVGRNARQRLSCPCS